MQAVFGDRPKALLEVSGRSLLAHAIAEATPIDPSQYVTDQVWYPSKDGTRVPMFLTLRKGAELDGSHPTMLFGYGGFNISTLPGFSASRIAWLEQGGVYARLFARGGWEG